MAEVKATSGDTFVLLKPATRAPIPPLVLGPLVPTIRFPDGSSRRATAAEWETFKASWGVKRADPPGE